jgi:hypothetical protein
VASPDMTTQPDVAPDATRLDEVPLLEVDNLQVEFRTRDGVAKAVNGVSYSVDEGETLAVLGEMMGRTRRSLRRTPLNDEGLLEPGHLASFAVSEVLP